MSPPAISDSYANMTTHFPVGIVHMIIRYVGEEILDSIQWDRNKLSHNDQTFLTHFLNTVTHFTLDPDKTVPIARIQAIMQEVKALTSFAYFGKREIFFGADGKIYQHTRGPKDEPSLHTICATTLARNKATLTAFDAIFVNQEIVQQATQIATLTDLRVKYITSGKMHEFAQIIAKATRLTRLSLNDESRSDYKPLFLQLGSEGLVHILSSCPALTYLDYCHMPPLSNEALAKIAKSRITTLNLNFSKTRTNSGLTVLQTSAITHLSIRGHAANVVAITSLQSLTFLDVSENGIALKDLPQLAFLPNLVNLFHDTVLNKPK